MKTGNCIHWFGFCGIQEKCIFKRNGDCTKDGIIEHRALTLDKIEGAGKVRMRNKYNGIRDLNN